LHSALEQKFYDDGYRALHGQRGYVERRKGATGKKEELMKRKEFILALVGAAAATTLPLGWKRCRTCGAATDTHLIDCARKLGSRERARTVCFSCEPRARAILKYWHGFGSVMHARKNNVKCSECGTGLGYIHVEGKPFEYRLCIGCAPDAKDARRWVRDLR